MTHPDPRFCFCVCGHHRDGHAGAMCYGTDCGCVEYRLSPDADRLAHEALLSHRENVPTSCDLERDFARRAP